MTAADATETPRPPGAGRRAVWWLFQNRQTGRLTVAQWPNIPLLAFIVLTFVVHVAHPAGRAETVLRAVSGAAIIWWATDEILRGVNPFRRALGLVVLVLSVVSVTMLVL